MTSYFLLYAVIATYRVLNALLLNTQFDPDEFWQTLEPAYCLAFSTEYNCAFTWEWSRKMEAEMDNSSYSTWINEALNGPVRSFVPILPTYYLYKILQCFDMDSTWMVARAPLLLNAAIVAAPTDFAAFYLSQFIFGRIDDSQSRGFFQKVENWVLLASITNWFNGYSLVRTYSNSMETALLSMGMALLCPELFGKINVADDYKIRGVAKFAFLLGGLSVTIRFTALAAWIPVGIIICCRRKSTKSGLFYLWHMCILGGLAGVILGCAVDRYFYGFGAIPFLGSFHFNVLQGNGALYGTHPWYWYILLGLPAIAGILTPLFLVETFQWIRRQRQKTQSTEIDKSKDVLFIITISYVAFHSLSSHKEFRFILPILPMVCVLSGFTLHRVYTREFARAPAILKKKRWLLSLLVIFNYPHMVFLCIIHQRAPIDVNKVISRTIAVLEQRQDFLKDSYSVHYLMGCHSAPLFSHLHIPKGDHTKKEKAVRIEAWHLDCSPECRSNATILCESERFSQDPFTFISQEYGITKNEFCLTREIGKDTCNETTKQHQKAPNFLALFEEDIHQSNGDVEIRDLLTSMGMIEFEKLRHSIRRVQIVKAERPKDSSYMVDNALFIRLPFDMGLMIEFWHMLLFISDDTAEGLSKS